MMAHGLAHQSLSAIASSSYKVYQTPFQNCIRSTKYVPSPFLLLSGKLWRLGPGGEMGTKTISLAPSWDGYCIKNIVKGKAHSIAKISKDLADDIVHFQGCEDTNRPLPCRYASTLRRTVQEISTRHEILFSAMVNKLDIYSMDVGHTFKDIADEIFKDKCYNWGRIVSLYAFAARLAKHFVHHNQRNRVSDIANHVGLYIGQNLSPWIEEQGGWDAFELHFNQVTAESVESFVWKGLMVTAVGLGALAATMISVR